MTFQSLPPAGRQLETASAITYTFFVDLCFSSFNFTYVYSMSSD
jgi:hypothetical protein